MGDDGEHKMPPEKREEYSAKFRTFLDTEFDSKWLPFKATHLTGIPLSPLELMAIEPFVTGFDEWAEETNAIEALHTAIAEQEAQAGTA